MSSTSSPSTVASYTVPVITSYVHLGALPTTTTLPPNCLSDALNFQVDGLGLPWTYYTVGCARSQCCPSSNFYSSSFQWYSEYYSPAVCPSGYEPVAADPIISTRPSETVRFCCPTYVQNPMQNKILRLTISDSGFTGPSSAAGFPNAATLTAPYYNWACQDADTSYPMISVYDGIIDQKFLSATSSSVFWYALAYPIQIRWKQGDFDDIGTLTSTSSNSTAASTSLATTPMASSATESITKSNRDRLSTGAIAGICVALGVLAIIALVAIAIWFRRRSKRRVEQEATGSSYAGKAAVSQPSNHQVEESKPLQPQELFATPEIDSDTRYELPAAENDPR